MSCRRALSLMGVVSMSGTMCLVGASANADTVRTNTTLGGYSVAVDAAPFKILLDDPNLPIPRAPGAAVAEADPSYTAASTNTGPNSYALSSSLWPGGLFGEGLPQINSNLPQYPVKAEARWPDKPYTATAADGGALMNASAMGLTATSNARTVPEDEPGVVTIGTLTSTSTTTVNTANVAVGDIMSKIGDVDLLGLIHIGSVSTVIHVGSDGKKPASTGTTTVSGLTVAGVGYTVDGTGVHVAGSSTPVPSESLSQLGITISPLTQVTTRNPTTTTRVASGLIIKIDTAPLEKALSPVTGALQGPLGTVIQKLPAATQPYLYYLSQATPQITYILGAGEASSAAVLPISFDFPPGGLLPPVLGGVVPPTTPGSPGTPGTAGTPGITPSTGVTAPSTLTPPADIAPVTTALGTFLPPHVSEGGSFGGIPFGAIVGVLAVAGLGAWGLMSLLGLIGGVPLGLGCRLGAPTDLPNLRSVTA